MLEERYYSVRMRAAQNGSHEQGGKHISGGEEISTFENLTNAVNTLLEKGLTHSRGIPDFMQIQFEMIHEPIKQLQPLPVATNQVVSAAEGQEAARKLLETSGVPTESIARVYEKIAEYSEPRGAILFDIRSNQRVDARKERGVRASRMDWLHTNFVKWANLHNLPCSPRIKEALVLATKVNRHPAAIAELCWSDDPEYITGYVASKKLGYQRITKLKEYRDEQGCRIFFVDGAYDLEAYIDYLEKQPIFIQWEEKNGAQFN